MKRLMLSPSWFIPQSACPDGVEEGAVRDRAVRAFGDPVAVRIEISTSGSVAPGEISRLHNELVAATSVPDPLSGRCSTALSR